MDQQPSKRATEIAAQIWCRRDCAEIQMDTRLAFAFAQVLDERVPYLSLPEGALRPEPTSFEERIRQAINFASKENGSNTPDFILAEFLSGCLSLFELTVNSREKYYGREPQLISKEPNPQPTTPP